MLGREHEEESRKVEETKGKNPGTREDVERSTKMGNHATAVQKVKMTRGKMVAGSSEQGKTLGKEKMLGVKYKTRKQYFNSSERETEESDMS